MQRIRYKKQGDSLISVNDIISQKTGAKYSVVIDLINCNYVIKNVLSLRKYEGGQNINNMNVLKRTIKKHLEALGCVFDGEKRRRTFGKCPKGWNQELEMKKQKQETKVQ